MGRDMEIARSSHYEAINSSPGTRQWMPDPVRCNERKGQIGDALKNASVTHQDQLTVGMMDRKQPRTVWLRALGTSHQEGAVLNRLIPKA